MKRPISKSITCTMICSLWVGSYFTIILVGDMSFAERVMHVVAGVFFLLFVHAILVNELSVKAKDYVKSSLFKRRGGWTSPADLGGDQPEVPEQGTEQREKRTCPVCSSKFRVRVSKEHEQEQ